MKIKSFAITFLIICLTLAGCGAAGANIRLPEVSDPPAADTPLTFDSGSADGYADEDLDSSWGAQSSTLITFNGDSANISGNGAAVSGSIVTISEAGTYVLSGQSGDGQVVVNAGKNDVVRLVLNGTSLENTSTAPIYAENAAKTILILADGTKNTFADAENYIYPEGGDEPDAAIFAKDDLTITGSGSLSVTGNFNNAIGSKDMLVITGGSITVKAKNDGLRGRDGIRVLNGSLDITADNDGIKSNNNEDSAKGFIVLDGGDYTITSGHDAVQAETSLVINGGSFSVLTGGGAVSAPVRQEDFRGGWNRGAPQQPAVSTQTAEEEASDSIKAFKAGTALAINDGSFTVDSEDDAFHSNGDVTVAGGSFTIKTGDDAFHADNALVTEGGEINIEQCYEGMEGSTVDINGGDIVIYASDDAINAAGGRDGNTQGPMGGDRFTAQGNYHVRITGGSLEAVASGDGIDANGNIFLEGGTLRISGPSMGMQGAVDFDGGFTITGGSMITAGSSLTPSSQSTQASLMVSYTSTKEKGSVIALKDAQGNTVLEYTAQVSYTMSAMTSPELKVGETYTLYMDGEKLTDVTLSSGVTAISDNGEEYSGGRGGSGRGFGAGGNKPGDIPPGGGRGPGRGFQPPDGGDRMPDQPESGG